MIKKKIKTWGKYLALAVVCVWVWWLYAYNNTHHFIAGDTIDNVTIVDDGTPITLPHTQKHTVEEIIHAYDTTISLHDVVFPAHDARIFSNDVIVVERTKNITVHADGEERHFTTKRDTITHFLAQNAITLDENDLITPKKEKTITNDIEIDIVRVTYKEDVVAKKIPFETVHKKDDTISFLKKFTQQHGKNGTKEITYRIAYHDGKEVDRKKVSEEVTQKPIDEIIVQGTKVKLGKKHTGACSWYAHTGTMAAANPWLPKGSYVKVTNKANGKSVIVKINDRGPFVPGRIIDLDKVAFEKIASLGAGVIDVKMEEIIQ